MIGKIKNRNILLKTLRRAMEKEEDVLFAYLYGSRVYDPVFTDSDIDVAVYLTHSDMKGYLERERRILSNLIDHIHSDRIDLRILNVMPLVFRYRVLKEGVPILVKDEQARVDFDTLVMNRFFDLKPYLEEYQEMLCVRIRAGIHE